ncbi:transposase [Mycobacterium sp. SM1]|nr:transposase [Mycobacterium sp. SM1]MBS4726879.1 transposase [Mycobacterium sp. SM1]
MTRITAARNRTRQRVWSLIEERHGAIPPIATAYGDICGVIGIRIDATLINSYSDKQCAAGNFTGGFGFHPLTAWCANTGECLAIIARPGNAGSNTATDHIAIIDAAIAALPAKYRRWVSPRSVEMSLLRRRRWQQTEGSSTRTSRRARCGSWPRRASRLRPWPESSGSTRARWATGAPRSDAELAVPMS